MRRETMDDGAPAFPIGMLAKRTGLTVEGIRFYEKAGILPAPARTTGGQRLYSLRELKRLNFIRRARDLGFTLDEVRALLRLVDEAPVRPCAEARDLAAEHLGDVRAKIADLRRMERALSAIVARCAEGEAPECPLIEALFAGASASR
jgi:MerR family transcriptional regulator, mercuric resistance operon regulatory protein